jgi:hypothetical protein
MPEGKDEVPLRSGSDTAALACDLDGPWTAFVGPVES